MRDTTIQFNNISFSYESSSENLFQDLTLHIAAGWAGVVGPNGAGKTTLLKLATGLLHPLTGSINLPSRVCYCSQRTDEAPQHFRRFLADLTRSAQIIQGQLDIQADWPERWHTLSHGERKRAQIGVALWLEPDVLALDEPTNHVDSQAKEMLTAALDVYPGIGLLVSHDRALLDGLCGQCLFVEPPHVVSRKGGYTEGRRIADNEQKALQRQRAQTRQTQKRLRRQVGHQRNLTNQADRQVSKKGIPRKDHAAKAKIDGARLSGKDAVGGKRLQHMEGRLARVQEELDTVKTRKEHSLGIWLPGSRSRRAMVLDLPASVLDLGGGKRLQYPKLFIDPDDRVGITGCNGSGKSTLLGTLTKALNVPHDHVTYVPQEISASRSRSIIRDVRALPPEQKGHLMTIVSCLGSRPRRLLESEYPSPGEVRKLLLALGMTREPHVIVMDEPTNHMDLPSIECLEAALAPCPCSLVLISHDHEFLGRLTRRRWHIHTESANRYRLDVE